MAKSQAVKKPKTIRFFEVVKHEGGRMNPWDWETITGALVGVDLKDRTIDYRGEEILGTTWTGDAKAGTHDMLLLSQSRIAGELPEILDRTKGTIKDVELAEGQGLVETSQAMFFPQANVVGMIRSNASPSTNALATWINNMALIEDQPAVHIQPLARVDMEPRLADVEQAKSIFIRMNTSAGPSIAASAPRLAGTMAVLNERFGPVSVEIKISVQQFEGFTAESQAILDEAQGLQDVSADVAQKVQLEYQSIDSQRRAMLDLIKDDLAMKVRIDVRDQEGRAVRNPSAAAAIKKAYEQLKPDIDSAVATE